MIIYGSVETLENIDYISTENLVLPAEADIVSRAVPLILPDGVTLRRGQSGSVTLSATVTEKTGERTLEVPLTYTHLSNDLLMAEGAPTYVTVVASGPLFQLEQLTADMFTVQADLTGYGPGEWELVPLLQNNGASRFPSVIAALQEQRIRVKLMTPAMEEAEPQTGSTGNP